MPGGGKIYAGEGRCPGAGGFPKIIWDVLPWPTIHWIVGHGSRLPYRYVPSTSAATRRAIVRTSPAIESPGWDLLLSVLRPTGRAFHYLQSTATQLRRRFRPLRWAMGALPLNPTIFREKLSKAFFVLGRGSTQIRAFRWDVSITQEHSFRRNASPTSAPADPGRPVPPAGTPPPADRRKYFPAHAVLVLRPPLPPCRAARWSRAPSPFGSPSFSAPFS